jgi:hypothetical protein
MGWFLNRCFTCCNTYSIMFNIFKYAIIRKFAYILVGIFFAFITDYVFAGTHDPIKVWNPDSGSAVYNTADEACIAFANTQPLITHSNTVINSANSATCRGSVNGGNEQAYRSATARWGCDNYPAFGSYSVAVITSCTNSCQPNETWDIYTDTCTAPNPCEPLENVNTSYFTPSTSFLQCIDGCEVERIDGNCANNNQGEQGCFLNGFYNGNQCTASVTPPTNSPEFDCLQSGQSYGEVNGVVVCTDIGSNGSTPVTEVANNSKTVTDSQGTTQIDTEISTDGQTVTKTTTTVDPLGNPSTIVEQQDKAGFCEENPNSPLCKEATDPCEDNPDRVGCLSTNEIPTPETVDTNAINITTQTISLPSSSGCPSDYSVSIGQALIPITYAPICQYASAFNPFVILFAWLTSAYIVYLAVRKG